MQVLLIERNGRRQVSVHLDYPAVIEHLRSTCLRTQDQHIDDVDELFETLHGPGYALSILITEHPVPTEAGSRISVLVTESEDGPGTSLHNSTAAAREFLAQSWGVALSELQAQAASRETTFEIITLALPR